MAIDRKAAIDYAKKFWNRVCDDDKFWTTNAPVSLAAKRKSMSAPAAEGWEAFFVSNGNVGENAIFRRTVNGKTEDKPDPIADWNALDDCTHYVCRCLIKEGIDLTETPRANELTEAMIKHRKTKTLTLKTTMEEGQKIINSGIFKPGDMIGYYTEGKGRYTHTAMFVGKQSGGDNDPGGITCHTVCRFEGLTQAWNSFSDDAWFLHEGLTYTLVHFSEDDSTISAATLKWLPGWWKVGTGFYFVTEDGHAFSTPIAPTRASQKLQTGHSVGYYFEVGQEVVFVWRKPGGKAQVERWTTRTDANKADLKIDGVPATAARVF